MSEIIVEFPSRLTAKEKEMIYGYNGELIRCKDCKWWGLPEYNAFNTNDTSGIHTCKKFGFGLVRSENDFCSRAERSEE